MTQNEVFAKDLLKQQHILISGGGSGLGRSFALRLGALGARVTVLGRRLAPLEETVTLLAEEDAEALAVTCDIRERKEVTAALRIAEDSFGPVTSLINNAAANFLSDTASISHNGFDAIIKTNLYGTFNLTQICGSHWIAQKIKGSVVTISTTYAQTGSAFVVASAMSKSAVEAMTKSLAVEWGTFGIRLNAIEPGPFPTEGAWTRLVPDTSIENSMLARIPLGRFGEHHELEDLVVFLVSQASSFITGAVITIDGGEVLQSGGQFNEFARMNRTALTEMFDQMKRSR